jgi:ABC-2 type transport system permease protein
MHKVWVIIRREFVEKVRTKWFVISTVLGPLLMASFIVVPILMAERGASRREIRVVDATTDGFGGRIVDAVRPPLPIEAELVSVSLERVESVADSLTTLVGEKQLDGYLIVTDATVANGSVEYRGKNVSSLTDMQILESVLGREVLTARLGRAGVDREVVAAAQIPVRLQTVSIRGGKVTEESGTSAFVLAYAVWIILYMSILLYGVQVMGAVVEEKTSRVIEVLVSSLRPFQLLAGKILGVGAVGLFQLSIWAVSALVLFHRRDLLLEMVGARTGGMVGAGTLPAVSVATLAIVLAYFLLGYFLYAAMFAAVAAMSNSEAEARQAQMPVVMLLVVPTVLMVGILQQPDGGMAVALSLIPFTAPIAMPVRWAAATVPLPEILGSVVLLGGTLLLVVWITARIYRVGILMYGKRPSPRELWRWVRAS